MGGHRNNYKTWQDGKKIAYTRSYLLFEKYGVENCYIELIETFPCNSIEEQRKREGEIIKLCPTAVNKYVAGRTPEQWYQDNKKIIIEKQETYRSKNKHKFPTRDKAYRENNKEKVKESYKKFRENHKEEIIDKGKHQKFICECGVEIRKSNKCYHLKTQKHLELLKLL
jgi:hypothetical protein